MTDELQTPAPKQMWTRCPACSTVMPNIGIAKQGHKLNCPHDIQLELRGLRDEVGRLTGLISGVNGHVESLTAEPAVDLAGVADWDDEGEEGQVEHVTVQTSSIPVQVPRIPNPFDDDDEDDLR